MLFVSFINKCFKKKKEKKGILWPCSQQPLSTEGSWVLCSSEHKSKRALCHFSSLSSWITLGTFSEAAADDLERGLSDIQGCMTSINSALTLVFFASGRSDRYTLIASQCCYGYMGLASASDPFLSFHAFRRASCVSFLLCSERLGLNVVLSGSRLSLLSKCYWCQYGCGFLLWCGLGFFFFFEFCEKWRDGSISFSN